MIYWYYGIGRSRTGTGTGDRGHWGTVLVLWLCGRSICPSMSRSFFFEVDARGGRGAWESFISHLFLLFSFDRDSTLLVGPRLHLLQYTKSHMALEVSDGTNARLNTK